MSEKEIKKVMQDDLSFAIGKLQIEGKKFGNHEGVLDYLVNILYKRGWRNEIIV